MRLEQILAKHRLSGYQAQAQEIIEQVRAAGAEGLHQDDFDRHFVDREILIRWGGNTIILPGQTLIEHWIYLAISMCAAGLIVPRGADGNRRYFLP